MTDGSSHLPAAKLKAAVALLTLLLGVSGFIQPYRLKTLDLPFFLSRDNQALNPSEGDLLSRPG